MDGPEGEGRRRRHPVDVQDGEEWNTLTYGFHYFFIFYLTDMWPHIFVLIVIFCIQYHIIAI